MGLSPIGTFIVFWLFNRKYDVNKSLLLAWIVPALIVISLLVFGAVQGGNISEELPEMAMMCAVVVMMSGFNAGVVAVLVKLNRRIKARKKKKQA